MPENARRLRPEIEQQVRSLVGEEHALFPAPEGYTIDGLRPAGVVFPGTIEEVVEIVRLADAHALALVPIGSGRRLHWGNIPERVDLILSTRRLNRIVEYEPSDLTASVEAGCRLQAFNQHAQAHRQWLPFDPPEAERATLGGIAAADDFGPLRQGYGRPRDYVIGLEVVQPEGTRVRAGGRVVKNVTGYDLNKLFVGSFGTLGILVRVNFKLRPRPEAEATVALFGSEWETLEEGARRILRADLLPMALLLTNEVATSALFPGMRAKALLVRFLETSPAVAYEVKSVGSLAPRSERLELPEETSRALWVEIGQMHRLIPTDLLVRLHVLPAETDRAVRTAERALAEHLSSCYITAQPGIGIVHVGGRCVEDEMSALARALLTVRASLAERGHMILERAPRELKQVVEVWGEVGSSLSLMRALKHTFDPKRLLSPGRFVARL